MAKQDKNDKSEKGDKHDHHAKSDQANGQEVHQTLDYKVPVGGRVLSSKDIEYNVGRYTVTLKVRNTGDRPIQIGSHYHFFEVNRYLEFDRAAAFGMRLDVPATTGVRFEPGDEKEVTLVELGGKQRVYGFDNLVDGWTGGRTAKFRPNLTLGMEKIEKFGFKDEKSHKTKK